MRTKYDKVLIVGIGGGGCKIVRSIAKRQPADWVHLVALDSDVADLEYVDGVVQIPVGENWTHGLGCGGDAVIGERIAADILGDLRELLDQVDLTILVTCMGGGTGSGAVQLLHRLLREEECLGFSFAVMPMEHEGSERTCTARQSVEAMRKRDDLVITIENDTIFKKLPKETPLTEALDRINQFVADGVLGLAAMVRSREGVPLDLAAVYKLLSEKPASCSFLSVTASGDDRTRGVVDQLLNSPASGGMEFVKEANVLVGALTGSAAMSLGEMDETLQHLRSRLNPSTRTLIAASPIDGMAEETLQLTVLAIQYEREKDRIPKEELEKMAFGELTMKMAPSKSYLPMTSGDASGILGIFGTSSPTIWKGENLDMPTFVRKGISLQEIVNSLKVSE